MRTQFKKLDIKAKTATITVKFEGAINDGDREELQAIAIILGAYNLYGRGLNLTSVHRMQGDFGNTVFEMKGLLKKRKTDKLIESLNADPDKAREIISRVIDREEAKEKKT